MSNNPKYEWAKQNEDDKIWWLCSPDIIDESIFSFDCIQKFHMWQDYPYKLTPEQKEIFDKENPYWADFFKDRAEEWEKSQKK
jgi:hypothetical protein